MKKDTKKQNDTGELSFKLPAVEELTHDAIIGKDLQGVITSWNKGAERIYGYTAEEIIGQAISILFPPGQADEIPWILEKIRRGETIGHYETVCTGKGCRQVYVSLNVTPSRNSRGEIVGASSIARDITWRKKAEETIRMQAQILDQIHEAVITTDLDGYITCWNKGAEKLYLYTSDEVLGRHISIIYPEEERELLQQGVIAPLLEKGKHETEVQLRRKTGARFHALLLLTLLRDEKGAVTGMLGSSLDITDRKKAEEELKTSEEQFRLIYEKSPLGIAFVDAEGFLSACNDKFTEIAGAPRERLIGFNMKTDVRDPNIIAALNKSFAGQLAVYEGEYVTASGSKKIVMRTFYSPLHANVSFRGIMLLTEDISERKIAELKLIEALAEAQRFREAMDNVPAYIYMKDPQSRYVYANRPTQELFGCSAEELVGSDDTRFFPPDTVKRLREVDLRVFGGEKTTEEIDVADGAAGRRVYWEIKTPIYADEAQKTIWGLLGISADITERKGMEEERERLIADLQAALAKIKTLSGLLPICMHCKKIRDDKGYWHQLEMFIRDHSETEFTHSVCPDCLKEFYPKVYEKYARKEGEQ